MPWPTPDPDGWPTGEAPPSLDKLVDELIADTDRCGHSTAEMYPALRDWRAEVVDSFRP